MTTPASSVVRYSGFFKSMGVVNVLDYGAGTLRNALYLADLGMNVYAADIPQQVRVMKGHPDAKRLAGILSAAELKRSRLKVDLVICTYVFNIIVRRCEKENYLDNAVANLRQGGFMLVEVNSRQSDVGCASPLHHYFGCDDKARSYTHLDMDRFLMPHSFQRVCHYYSSHALAAVYRLTDDGVLDIKSTVL